MSPEQSATAGVGPDAGVSTMRLRLLGVVLAVVLTLGATHPSCNLLFDCGCTWLFWGGAEACNIHVPNPPHCPWCTGGNIRFTVVLVLTLAAQLGAQSWLLARRRGEPTTDVLVLGLKLLLVSVLGFAAAALAAGAYAAWQTNYPTFLG